MRRQGRGGEVVKSWGGKGIKGFNGDELRTDNNVYTNGNEKDTQPASVRKVRNWGRSKGGRIMMIIKCGAPNLTFHCTTILHQPFS